MSIKKQFRELCTRNVIRNNLTTVLNLIIHNGLVPRLKTYNGDTEHDMRVDFDHCENAGTPDVFDEANLEEI